MYTVKATHAPITTHFQSKAAVNTRDPEGFAPPVEGFVPPAEGSAPLWLRTRVVVVMVRLSVMMMVVLFVGNARVLAEDE